MSDHAVLSILSAPLVLLVRLYQRFVSPMRPATCRFYPSCSAYAVEALTRYGPLRGGWLAAKRLGRCHPWNSGGIDHVPRTWRERGSPALHEVWTDERREAPGPHPTT